MSSQTKHYEFERFRVDAAERVLLRDAVPVYLPPKAFDTLLVLVERSGHIIEKDELMRKVWPETFVEESNLTQYISVLRRTLGDERQEQRYIETIPRRGYRFVPPVRQAWSADGDLISATHTKASVAIKEETEEHDEAEQGKSANAETKLHEKTAPAVPRRWAYVLLALTALVAAAGFGFGLDQFIEKRQVGSAPLVNPAAAVAQAFTVKTFDPSVWPRTDAEVGITGFRIEDFEDAELVEGLRIELLDSTTDNFGTTDKLPVVFNPDFNDTGGGRVFVPGVWDGSHVLINRRTPSPHGYADYVWGDTAFHVPGGASSFGFSLHEMDRDTELSVNGVPLVNLRKLLPSGTTRGGYVRIDAAPGQAIFLVKVANSVTDTTGDGLAFDHVAFKPLQR